MTHHILHIAMYKNKAIYDCDIYKYIYIANPEY